MVQVQTKAKVEILACLRLIPAGRVTTCAAIAAHLKIHARLVETTLQGLNETERELAPWHRVVAKGGAIGRGPNRDAQFAKLMREGLAVSPAGVVQDMERVQMADFTSPPGGSWHLTSPLTTAPGGPGHPPSRSRGMKDRPGG